MSEFFRSGAIMMMAAIVFAAGIVVVFYSLRAAPPAFRLSQPCRDPRLAPLKGDFPAPLWIWRGTPWLIPPTPSFSKTRKRDWATF